MKRKVVSNKGIRRAQPVCSCKHHWEIYPPKGKISIGVCKLCGTKKEFANYLRDCKLEFKEKK